ncbi:MAG: hypothetical protein AVDCRST_MAG49-415, partial [uncultured Thermomicrobiales bacterium]
VRWTPRPRGRHRRGGGPRCRPCPLGRGRSVQRSAESSARSHRPLGPAPIDGAIGPPKATGRRL